MGQPGTRQARYFDWLYRMVKGGEYSKLCRLMHATTFRVLVDHDGNRVGDVAELKLNYMAMMRVDPRDEDTLTAPGASVFEVLVSLAQRMEYQTDLPIQVCFGIFIENLGLRPCVDDNFEMNRAKAVQIIHRFNDRLYRPNGQGGLFPLRIPRGDQRRIELWYQLAYYMTENEMY